MVGVVAVGPVAVGVEPPPGAGAIGRGVGVYTFAECFIETG